MVAFRASSVRLTTPACCRIRCTWNLIVCWLRCTWSAIAALESPSATRPMICASSRLKSGGDIRALEVDRGVFFSKRSRVPARSTATAASLASISKKSSHSWSGCRLVRLKTSITPVILPCEISGMARRALKPSRAKRVRRLPSSGGAHPPPPPLPHQKLTGQCFFKRDSVFRDARRLEAGSGRHAEHAVALLEDEHVGGGDAKPGDRLVQDHLQVEPEVAAACHCERNGSKRSEPSQARPCSQTHLSVFHANRDSIGDGLQPGDVAFSHGQGVAINKQCEGSDGGLVRAHGHHHKTD